MKPQKKAAPMTKKVKLGVNDRADDASWRDIPRCAGRALVTRRERAGLLGRPRHASGPADLGLMADAAGSGRRLRNWSALVRALARVRRHALIRSGFGAPGCCPVPPIGARRPPVVPAPSGWPGGEGKRFRFFSWSDLTGMKSGLS